MKKFLSVYFLLFVFEIYVVPVYAEDVAAQEGIQRVQAISFTSGTEKSMEISFHAFSISGQTVRPRSSAICLSFSGGLPAMVR